MTVGPQSLASARCPAASADNAKACSPLQHALFGPAYRAGDAASDGRETSRRAVYRVGWDYLGASAVKRPASEAFPVINPNIRILFAGEKGGRRRRLGCLPNAAECLRPAACLACSRQGRVVGVRPGDWCAVVAGLSHQRHDASQLVRFDLALIQQSCVSSRQGGCRGGRLFYVEGLLLRAEETLTPPDHLSRVPAPARSRQGQNNIHLISSQRAQSACS